MHVLRRLHEMLPDRSQGFESVLYLADTRWFPYSALLSSQMRQRARSLTQFFDDHLITPPSLCVYACHSLSTHMNPTDLNPHSEHLCVVPAIDDASIGCSELLIMCTPTTAATYGGGWSPQNPVFRISKNQLVYGPLDLAQLSERQFFHSVSEREGSQSVDFEAELTHVLTTYKRVDRILLSCTHYIYSQPLIQKVVTKLGRHIEIMDSTDLILGRHRAMITQAYNPCSRPSQSSSQQPCVVVMSDYPSDQCMSISRYINTYLSARCEFISLKKWLPQLPHDE